MELYLNWFIFKLEHFVALDGCQWMLH